MERVQVVHVQHHVESENIVVQEHRNVQHVLNHRIHIIQQHVVVIGNVMHDIIGVDHHV